MMQQDGKAEEPVRDDAAPSRDRAMPPERSSSPRGLRAAWLLTIAIGVGLAVATLTPADKLPVTPPGGDKIHHALAFAVMVLPLTSVRLSAALWFAPSAALYGGLIEYIQPFTNRHGDLKDLAADLIGICAGVVAGCGLHFLGRALRNRTGG